MRFAVHLGFAGLLLLSALGITSCQNRVERNAVEARHLQDEYNKLYPAYEKDCLNTAEEDAEWKRMLKKNKNGLPTDEQYAAMNARIQARRDRCKPRSDHLAEIQQKILTLTNPQ